MSVYVDTIGFELNLTVTDQDDGSIIDITAGLGTLTLDVKKPDGSIHVWTPTVILGTAGTAQYKSVSGDFDQVGTYCLNGHWDPVSPDEDFFSEPIYITVRDRVR